MTNLDTQFWTIVCRECFRAFNEAGQLLSGHKFNSHVPHCEQCGRFLVDGETFRAKVEL